MIWQREEGMWSEVCLCPMFLLHAWRYAERRRRKHALCERHDPWFISLIWGVNLILSYTHTHLLRRMKCKPVILLFPHCRPSTPRSLTFFFADERENVRRKERIKYALSDARLSPEKKKKKKKRRVMSHNLWGKKRRRKRDIIIVVMMHVCVCEWEWKWDA